MIEISIERYEKLIACETRMKVLTERLCHDKYIGTEDILWIIGNEMAIERAEFLRSKKEGE